MEICTNKTNIEYEFFNAYDSSELGQRGEIHSDEKRAFINIENIKLDTGLILKSNTKKNTEMFVRHIGNDINL